MALHGELLVSGRVIGIWEAVRTEHPPQEINTYKVRVEFMDIMGVIHQASGTIEHEFGDGALVLASKVLAWADREITFANEDPETVDREPGR